MTMAIKQKITELTSQVNWNYIGLVASVLSIVVTIYNINNYYEEIQKAEKQ
jgi:hypothetical protein